MMDLSVCIPCFNRSLMEWTSGGVRRLLRPFLHTVRSIERSVSQAGVSAELVVADYGSTDWPLAEWIDDAARSMQVRVLNCTPPFTVGGGKNRAAEQAQAPILLFTETDLEVPPSLLLRGLELAREGKAYFPRYRREHIPGGDTYWGDGHGCCVVRKEHWQVNPWQEVGGWGDEDTRFWSWFKDRGLDVREDEPEFIHRWHPLTEAKQEVWRKLNASKTLTAKE